MKTLHTLIAASLLAGCATTATFDGVKPMDAEERAECAQTRTCQVWTENQLQRLIQFVWNKAQDAARKGGT